MKYILIAIAVFSLRSVAQASTATCLIAIPPNEQLALQIVALPPSNELVATIQRTGSQTVTVSGVTSAGRTNFGLTWLEFTGGTSFKLNGTKDASESPSEWAWSLSVEIPQLNLSIKDSPANCSLL